MPLRQVPVDTGREMVLEAFPSPHPSRSPFRPHTRGEHFHAKPSSNHRAISGEIAARPSKTRGNAARGNRRDRGKSEKVSSTIIDASSNNRTPSPRYEREAPMSTRGGFCRCRCEPGLRRAPRSCSSPTNSGMLCPSYREDSNVGNHGTASQFQRN